MNDPLYLFLRVILCTMGTSYICNGVILNSLNISHCYFPAVGERLLQRRLL